MRTLQRFVCPRRARTLHGSPAPFLLRMNRMHIPQLRSLLGGLEIFLTINNAIERQRRLPPVVQMRQQVHVHLPPQLLKQVGQRRKGRCIRAGPTGHHCSRPATC